MSYILAIATLTAHLVVVSSSIFIHIFREFIDNILIDSGTRDLGFYVLNVTGRGLKYLVRLAFVKNSVR